MEMVWMTSSDLKQMEYTSHMHKVEGLLSLPKLKNLMDTNLIYGPAIIPILGLQHMSIMTVNLSFLIYIEIIILYIY